MMLIEVYLPEGSDRAGLQAELSALEGELGVTIRFKPIDDAEVL